VYSTIVAVVSCNITLWILVEWWEGGQARLVPPPAGAGAVAVTAASGSNGCLTKFGLTAIWRIILAAAIMAAVAV